MRAPHAAMSTAGLLAGIASTGGSAAVSSAAASSGSVFWWPAEPALVRVSRLPPSSVAAVASAQFAGASIGAGPVLIVVVLPATIEPWKRALVLWE